MKSESQPISGANPSEYTCPMHPEVRQASPGNCPKCGMTLEPVIVAAPTSRTEYTCPMHPQIVRSEPGNCPICGMALEPRAITSGQEENKELMAMNQRFWVSVILTALVLIPAMGDYLPGHPLKQLASARVW